MPSCTLDVAPESRHGVLVDLGANLLEGTELARGELGYLPPGRTGSRLYQPRRPTGPGRCCSAAHPSPSRCRWPGAVAQPGFDARTVEIAGSGQGSNGRRTLDLVRRHVDDAVAKGAPLHPPPRPDPTSAHCSTNPPSSRASPTTWPSPAKDLRPGRRRPPRRGRRRGDRTCQRHLLRAQRQHLEHPVPRKPDRHPHPGGHGQHQRGLRLGMGQLRRSDGRVKDSGTGRRHGRDGILKYTQSQTIAVQRGLPIGPPPGIPLDRYAAMMTTALKALKRLPFLKQVRLRPRALRPTAPRPPQPDVPNRAQSGRAVRRRAEPALVVLPEAQL